MSKSFARHGSVGLLSVLVLVILAATAFAAAQEGVDYVVLEKPIPNMANTVLKVFSYDCPFCYRYDKAVTANVAAILAKDGVKFTVWHLKNKGQYGVQASEVFAALITKDQKTGLGLFDDKASFKKAKFAYYTAYHDKRERWDKGADAFIETGLEAAGVSRPEFQALLKDPATQARLRDWEGAVNIAKIQGIPAFVVKGKYLLYTKSIKSVDGMAETIKELMAK